MREIGRLRLKFIIYNMLVVTAVIGITFCAVTSVVKHRVNDQGSLALSRVVSGEEQSLIFAAMPPVRMPYFTVLVAENGEVIAAGERYNAYRGPESWNRWLSWGWRRGGHGNTGRIPAEIL